MALLPVDEALKRILEGVKPLAAEDIALERALGRVLSEDVKARRDQPPFAASAMDGYAVQASDLSETPVTLKLIGVSAAGHPFRGKVKSGQAVRIFTGAPVPDGADAVVIQENTKASGDEVSVLQPVRVTQNVRDRGLDFRKGEVLLPKGIKLGARDIGLAAAANAATLRVRKKPVVALFATGDELVKPGDTPKAGQIVSSNSLAIEGLIRLLGGEPMNLGIVKDTLAATTRAVERARGADILVTTGGASVGDHDFVQEALKAAGVKIDFWKIAMRPGKPFMYGRRGRQHVMGLPGNPVSALVCARLFLQPLISALLGYASAADMPVVRLGSALKANDERQDYIRATLRAEPDGSRTVIPFGKQDSSMFRTFREADCLIIRPPHAPEAPEGTVVPVLLLDF